MEADILYKITAHFRVTALEVSIFEYEITNETSKNYMAQTLSGPWKGEKLSFPKEDEGKVNIDQFSGNFHRASLFLTEISREDVETHGVDQLKQGMREWFEKRAIYFTKKVEAIDNHNPSKE